MKIYSIISLLALGFLIACGNAETKEVAEKSNTSKINAEENSHEELNGVEISASQFDALAIEIGEVKLRNMAGMVKANGQLEVPPQNEASVTTVYGANIKSIEVIEGHQVNKGQVLAYISHPEIVDIQTRFLNAFNQFQLKEKEYARQKKLYDAGVSSGEKFQITETEFQNAKQATSGLKAQLKLLNINPKQIIQGKIYQQVPIISPINGAVEKVNVKTGQYVDAQTELFEILNTKDVHADLMVFEKDIQNVENGQKVMISLKSRPDLEMEAVIISVGQAFEENPKAVHIHAEIENKPKNLIPGMYLTGRIITENNETEALPTAAIFTENDRDFIFKAEKNNDKWIFSTVEVKTGIEDGDWISITFMNPEEKGAKFALNNAYYLQAEMNKGEGGHEH
ncbi:efflux RND transporter periplasmic adaptor subunit [Zunongwangia sp. HGR-M22]|uniref:efflux RND transporter periplasmic adaptor subunit n=1 Tax=Zunongwangia sp. HGR-M22 TaxID=3015168 RepID=UPI0022DD7CB1|nr:efflux RND transporter periplasmic adaptor subunit [Zunongwangia sp. HGR-M22]WBL25303.1 efflux RND transporter periplasmic adaptor subunit [Zunongwangia sp. HGR-M22]